LFRPNLFTIWSITYFAIVILIDKWAAAHNTDTLLSQAHGMNYFYTEPLGLVGNVALLWGTSKVYMTNIRKDMTNVWFVVKVYLIHDLDS